jgi:hypothetical protein
LELNTDSIWTALAASMRDVPVGAPFTVADVEAALGRREAQIRAALDAWVERRKARSSTSIELQAPAERTRANLAAARLLVRGAPFSPDDQATLALYSGWGGLSIDKIRDQWPSGLPQPEKRGLIHEYYTPLRVWQEVVRVLLPLIPGLHGDDVLRVLEPSVGIGRALEALRLAGVQAQITAAEYSEVSARLVAARFPAARLHKGPFEELATDLYLNPHLVLSNPPYGVRGGSKTADPVREYRRKDDGSDRKAYVYFLRRTLDLLTPGGVGVYLVPSGFMTGTGGQLEVLRRRVLRRHHLLGAFRLPSGLFPGAWLVTDLLFFRSRGGELPGVLDTDEKIALGGYFKAHPAHILGEEKGQEKGEDDQSKKPRWGYEVVGTFTRLPDPDWRPMLGEVAPSTARRRVRQVSATRTASQAVADSASDDVGRAVEIGLRADLVFAGKADGWAEMARDAKAWATHYGNPHKHEDLSLAAQRGQTGALRFLSLFAKNGQPTEALLTAPKKVGGAVKHTDPHLAGLDIYKNNKGILLPSDLAALGFAVDPAALRRLTDQGWCLDPARSSYRLLRPEHYYTGLLWPRLDRLDGHTPPPPLADALKAQRARLMELIDPDPITEIQHSPLDGFVPADLLAKWFGAVLFDKVGFSDADAPNFSRAFGSTLGLHRINAGIVLTVNGEVKPYSFLNDQHPSRKNEKILPQLLRCLFGWINYDRALFTPPRQKEEELDDVRARVASAWMAHWEAWVQADPERADALAVAYNRHFKGRIPIEYGTDEIPLARWSGALTPHSYQRRSIQRLHDRRGGILALDVGLGKTATGIYTLGLARQEGWAQRPVIVVPNTLLFKWKADIERLLTGYRVLVVGAKAKITKDGEDDLVPDSAVERGAKWTEFQSGLWDVVVMPYSMLGASRFNEARLRQYAETCGELALVARAEIEEAERQQKVNEGDRKGKAKPLTERQKAILEEGLYGWIAGKLELAEGREYDAGIAWDDLGIDFLMIDEGQNFKNLFTPKPREGGEVPKYMGASASSARAWQLHVRAWDVRTRNSKDGGDNGAGVVILSATPAKNSPLEFYSLSNFTTPSIWRERGIRNSEEFIERFIALDTKPLIDPSGAVKSRSYVAGFRSLHELRVALARGHRV